MGRLPSEGHSKEGFGSEGNPRTREFGYQAGSREESGPRLAYSREEFGSEAGSCEEFGQRVTPGKIPGVRGSLEKGVWILERLKRRARSEVGSCIEFGLHVMGRPPSEGDSIRIQGRLERRVRSEGGSR